MWAAMKGRLEIAEALANAGADLDLHNGGGWTALHCAAGNDEPAVVLSSKPVGRRGSVFLGFLYKGVLSS